MIVRIVQHLEHPGSVGLRLRAGLGQSHRLELQGCQAIGLCLGIRQLAKLLGSEPGLMHQLQQRNRRPVFDRRHRTVFQHQIPR